MSWVLSAGSVLGRDHAALRRSAQDAHASGATSGAAWGVVCDGCGEGGRSEVGAGLAAAYLAAEMERLILAEVPLEAVPARALSGLVDLFATITRSVALGVARDGGALSGEVEATPLPLRSTGTDFVRQHLLSTAVGFCTRGAAGVVFWSGDGLLSLDDELWVIDEDNRPSYAAYALLGDTLRVGTRAFDAREVSRVAVATDGFDRALVPSAFGKHGRALQRWMQRCAREGHFRDDATIVVAERG